MLDISYGYYLISLFILTGIIILLLDVKTHSTNNQKKEKRVILFLGWGNIVLGSGFYIISWIYQKWFW
ncbi:CLC_0170 family protein [Bacillus sp. SD088]|uniref:CLC_0170 family protein n=1 Tax=Bacillus sp. SD088 TaxID=2782012 RepID=UPI001A967A56|nr:CLC_0170 family protein [Bacillus sp. SD088]